ncbi:MAG: ABC transporter permease subunit [Chloroflexi bacterium AL-W]|nr:ABC transporter permease subunit [Chloroflexi bacterium AL-N1]NOK65346.1 ABC transporter permease subunit [Chloroflexi bacterium AL-N10]NOK72389.1 ABC transporter permease subunit [Chloroflexi bacterium AL-N5]NOK79525.1 ABC transporter permease subunit [Chloroflexi bacterium AL-W]NOK87441.1 ABC transporter permease subunit [Chloroflexi bacterium AL-N15]
MIKNVWGDNMVTQVLASKRRTNRISLGQILAWLAWLLSIMMVLVPFWWMIRTALSTNRELYANPSVWLPVGFTFDSFGRILGFVDMSEAVAADGSGQPLNFWLYLRNSIVVTVLVVVGQLFLVLWLRIPLPVCIFPSAIKSFFCISRR